jgi:peptidoglycan/LPS O-acetylase OafA/YrhL
VSDPIQLRDRAPTRASDGRVLELDAVRGLAAAMVLICHVPQMRFWFGASGVDLFFVLSGFLITGIILKNRERAGFLRIFYTRRALRILPIYYLALGVMVAINALRSHPGRLDGLWYYLTYLQNVPMYWGAETPPLDLSVGHMWTLAIEEQFYLLWPLAMVMLPLRFVPWLCGLLFVTSPILRYYGFDRMLLLAHMDGLVLGGFLAFLELKFSFARRALLNSIYAGLFLAGAIVYGWLSWQFMHQQGHSGQEMIATSSGIAAVSVTYFGLIGMVAAMSGRQWLWPLRWRPLTLLGSISYGLYLYHYIVFEYFEMAQRRFAIEDSIFVEVLKMAASVLVAVVSWRCIEAPILRLKDRLAYDSRQREAKFENVPAEGGELVAGRAE